MSTTSATYNPAESCPVLAQMSGADALGIPPTQEFVLGVDDHGCDFKVFGETSGKYMLWDESADKLILYGQLDVGVDDTGHDVTFFGDTSGDYVLWDASDDRLEFVSGAKMNFAGGVAYKPIEIGSFSGAASGSGITMTGSNFRALSVYVDDGDAAIGSGTMTRAAVFRNLQIYDSGNREQEAVGALGQIVSSGGTNRHNMAGLMGSYEARTSLTVGGQISSTDPWIQAGVIGRVGMASGTLVVSQYGVLAGLAAMSNVNTACTETFTGRFTGLYVGRWASANEFEYAIYAEDVQHGIYMTVDSGTVSGEEHGWELDYTGTLSSGDSLVGIDCVVTTAGTAGTWVSGAYLKVTQGSTKNVNGYISGLEIEVTNSAANVSDWFPLVLNASNSGAQQGSHSSYIALRDYGTTDIQSLLWISTDHTAGSTSATALWTSVTGGREADCDYAIRFIAGSTPYWILCTSVAP